MSWSRKPNLLRIICVKYKTFAPKKNIGNFIFNLSLTTRKFPYTTRDKHTYSVKPIQKPIQQDMRFEPVDREWAFMCQCVDGTTLICRSNLALLTSYRLKERKKNDKYLRRIFCCDQDGVS